MGLTLADGEQPQPGRDSRTRHARVVGIERIVLAAVAALPMLVLVVLAFHALDRVRVGIVGAFGPLP